jgi:hypothetical protein
LYIIPFFYNPVASAPGFLFVNIWISSDRHCQKRERTCTKADITRGRKEGITFHDIRRTVKTNMVRAGIDKVYRDTILGYSLKEMDVNYIVPTDIALTNAMDQYTKWLDGQLEKQNVD